ncbi:MAG: hypothetical protein HFE92_09530 [Acutalibacter muris]|nr:hypothetical protein [Acutalibacter muris]
MVWYGQNSARQQFSLQKIGRAAVHCVIVGVTCETAVGTKMLFETEQRKDVSHINGYLLDAPDVFIQSRGKVRVKGLPEMSKGSQPTDGGYLLLSYEEQTKLISDYPSTKEFVKRFVGSRDLINNELRYCLWLIDVSPAKYRAINPIVKRLQGVAESRKKSPTESVRQSAEIPMLFTQIRQPAANYHHRCSPHL